MHTTIATHPSGRSGSPSTSAPTMATWITSVFEYTVPTAKPRAWNDRSSAMVAAIWATPAVAMIGPNRDGTSGTGGSKIGGAWGRERGCQVVEISVVAVSVKKQGK